MHWKFHNAIKCIQDGGILAYPTEAVWGLGCDPRNDAAITSLLQLKHRPWQKGLILIAGDADFFSPLLNRLEPTLRHRILKTWPGPVTWVVPDPGCYSQLIRGKHPSVAIRVTNHPLTAKLTRLLGFPLVSTSANPASCAPAQTLLRTRCYFGSKVDHYLAGELGGLTRSSQIRDALSGRILRP